MPIRLPLGFEALLVRDGGWRIVLGDVASSLVIKKYGEQSAPLHHLFRTCRRQFQERQLSCESCVSFHKFCPEIPKKNAKHEHVCPPSRPSGHVFAGFLREFQEFPYQATAIPFNAVISACGKCTMWQHALELFQECDKGD